MIHTSARLALNLFAQPTVACRNYNLHMVAQCPWPGKTPGAILIMKVLGHEVERAGISGEVKKLLPLHLMPVRWQDESVGARGGAGGRSFCNALPGAVLPVVGQRL